MDTHFFLLSSNLMAVDNYIYKSLDPIVFRSVNQEGFISKGNRDIWIISVGSFILNVGSLIYNNPTSINFTAIDGFFRNERLRMTIYKNNNLTTPIAVRSVVSPNAATIGIPILPGDIFTVIIDYPAGFKPGVLGSGYWFNCVVYTDGWLW
jgi:hypothetical protein